MEGNPADRFHDGLTGASHPARFEASFGVLNIVDVQGRTLARWNLDAIETIDENEVNGSLTLARTGGEEGARLLLYPSVARDALFAARPVLSHWRRHRGIAEFKTVGIWIGITVLIVAAIYFGWRPLAALIATGFPPAWEAKIGEALRESMIAGEQRCDNEAGLDALRALAERMAPDSLADTPFTIDVVRNSEPNAFALPGNHIIVFEGLIEESDSPEMLAGVLAHELGHLDLDHPTRRIVEYLGLGIVISIAFGGGDLGNAGLMLATFSYSREAEAEADERAIVLLEKAGLRSDGLARFFVKLENDMPFHPPDWLSTHPDLEERAAANPGTSRGESGLSDSAWKSVRSVCNSSVSGS